MDVLSPRRTQCAIDARVARCASVCREHVGVELVAPDFGDSEPGQFVQLLCREADQAESAVLTWPADGFPSVTDPDLLATHAFLRRPFSIADRWSAAVDGVVHLLFIFRTVGSGTRWLARLQPGQTLSLTGPLGRGFRIPPDDRPLLLVGGGVGIPPLLYLARRLQELGRRDVTVIFGAKTGTLLPVRLTDEPARDGTPRPCVELPGAGNYDTIVTTDDGSVGLRGVVCDAVRAWHRSGRKRDRRAVVLACGPDAMLKATARLTRQLDLDCQLCIERRMGCGIGTCLSCVVRVRAAEQAAGWRWALTCADGPVFERDELFDYGD